LSKRFVFILEIDPLFFRVSRGILSGA